MGVDTLPAVGLPLREFWAAVRDLKPVAFIQHWRDPFLIELGGGSPAGLYSTGKEPTIRPATGPAPDPAEDRRRVLTVVKRRPGEKHKIAVGRAADNDVVLLSVDVSKLHAGFGLVQGGWRVADLGSTYGTTLDGRPLPPMVPVPIHGGQELGIGSMRHLFVMPDGFLDTARGILEAGRI